MRDKSLLAVAVLATIAGFLPLFLSSASASSTSPTISRFSPTRGLVGTTVTIKGTNLAGATSVTFGKTPATVVVDESTKIKVLVPPGATTSYLKVTTPSGLAKSASPFVVSLSGAMSVANDGRGYCALLSSGAVDCWGYGQLGALGDGSYYSTGEQGSATPVAVEGVGGTGTLTGVTSLIGDDFYGSYCALLNTGGVDCWGNGGVGELGNGKHHNRDTPVAVEGVGGTGTLSGITTITSNQNGTECALLNTGGVDCWGNGSALGAPGTLGPNGDSDTPVAVEGVGGTGTLTGVTSLIGGGVVGGDENYRALLTSGAVDCWGDGPDGELGNGTFSFNRFPVAVEGEGGAGTLTGVSSLVSNSAGYCALLTSGGVDCWGYGEDGELGNGTYYSSSPDGSASPVAVEGVGGTGTLTGVTSLVDDAASGSGPDGGGSGYCALLTSGGVDCWGAGPVGELGNGASNDSATPVTVEGVGGTGTLTGVMSLANDGFYSFCALLTSSGVDCWGAEYSGALGNGTASQSKHSTFPVAVEGVGATGTLSAVTSLSGEGNGGDPSFCAVVTSSGVDCWGAGYSGVLGDGTYSKSEVPVEVEQPS